MRFKIIIPALIIAASIGGLILLANAKQAPKQNDVQERVLKVDAIEANLQTVPIHVVAQGEVKAATRSKILSEVAATIIDVDKQFKDGQFVAAKTLLIRLDDRDYRSQVQLAKADVASAESLLATEQGQTDVALADWKKYNRNVKRSDAATALALRKPQLKEAKARLQAAKARLQQAQLNLERTQITAPFAGVIQNKVVDIGQYVHAGAMLFELVATDTAELTVAIPEHKLAFLDLPSINSSVNKPNHNQVSITTANSQTPRTGQLIRTAGILDKQTRSLQTIIEVDDPYALKSDQPPLLIGSFVTAKISGKQVHDIVVLPRHVIQPGAKVWLIDENDRLIQQTVTLLNVGDKFAYVTTGINHGDRICLNNMNDELPGTKVSINRIVASSELLASDNSFEKIKSTALQQPDSRVPSTADTVKREP